MMLKKWAPFIIFLFPCHILLAQEKFLPFSPEQPIKQIWTTSLNCGITTGIIEQDGLLYLAGSDSRLYCINHKNGQIIWKFQTEGQISSNPIIYKGRIYINSKDGNLYAIRANDSKLLFRYNHRDQNALGPWIVNDTLVLAITNPEPMLVNINPLNGMISSHIKLSGKPLTYNSTFIVDDSSTITCFTPQTGKINWTRKINAEKIYKIVNFDEKLLMFAGINGELQIYTIDTKSGVTTNQHNLPQLEITDTKVFKDTFIISHLRGLFCLERSFTVRWEKQIEGTGCIVLAEDGTIFYGAGSNIYMIDAYTGKTLAIIQTDHAIDSILFSNAYIYTVSTNGATLCFETGNKPPAPPTLIKPLQAQNTTSPILSVKAGFDQDEISATQIQFSINSDPQDLDITGETVLLTAESYMINKNIDSNSIVYWRARNQDSYGAWSKWSQVQFFWVNKDQSQPEPPRIIDAIPSDMSVRIIFDPSPSSDVLKYKLYYKPNHAPWSSCSIIDNITQTQVTVRDLENFVSYDFMLVATDNSLNDSCGTIISITPEPSIVLNGTAIFNSLQQAIDQAKEGDVIKLGVGEFSGSIIIKKNIHIIGHSAKHTKIIGSGSGAVVLIETAKFSDREVRLENISITGGHYGIYVNLGVLSLQNILIHSIIGNAINIQKTVTARVSNATIISNLGYGIASESDSTIKNSIVAYNGAAGIKVTDRSILLYNTSYRNLGGDYNQDQVNHTNSTKPAHFLPNSFFDSTYIEAEDSPTIDAGDPSDSYLNEPQPSGERINQGAYGDTKYATSLKTNISGIKLQDQPNCYVVTATLSVSDRKHIMRFVYLREKFIRTNPLGNAWLATYDIVGPRLAQFIANSKPTKVVAQHIIIAVSNLILAHTVVAVTAALTLLSLILRKRLANAAPITASAVNQGN